MCSQHGVIDSLTMLCLYPPKRFAFNCLLLRQWLILQKYSLAICLKTGYGFLCHYYVIPHQVSVSAHAMPMLFSTDFHGAPWSLFIFSPKAALFSLCPPSRMCTSLCYSFARSTSFAHAMPMPSTKGFMWIASCCFNGLNHIIFWQST